MALNIKYEEVDNLARQLSSMTGESITEAILIALRERLARQELLRGASSLEDRLKAIAQSCSALPSLDSRIDEEIVGYDLEGLPA